jgi:hypothetical protein
MNIYLANRGDYGGISTTPWSERALRDGRIEFDLERWRSYESWVRRLRDEGMAAHLWFFADDSDFGELPLRQRLALIRYGMARLSAFANTIFVLCLEWEEDWRRRDVDRAGRAIQEENPWRRLASVHGLPGDFKFADAGWVDYLLLQPGNNAVYDTVYTLGLKNRDAAAKPLLNEEFALGRENDAGRRKVWSALMAGAAGSGTGAYLNVLADFVKRIPLTEFAPAPAAGLPGDSYRLAAPGTGYLAYLPRGGDARIDLGGETGVWRGLRLDPRTGRWEPIEPVRGGGIRRITSSGAGDWALLLMRELPDLPPVLGTAFGKEQLK